MTHSGHWQGLDAASPVGGVPRDLSPELVDLLARVPVGAAAKADVVARMGGTDRFYHGLDHLAVLWRRHRRYGAAEGLHGEATDALVASAILFHDCIYDARRSDSEELSAEHWLRLSGGAGLAEADRAWVADTIRATRAHLSYQPSAAFASGAAGRFPPEAVLRERARVWLLDLDLTPLGEEPAAFADNGVLLRREVPHLSEAEWDRAQLRFLASFRAVPRIYRSATLNAAFEAQARRNIAQACGP